jgi:TonB family protein
MVQEGRRCRTAPDGCDQPVRTRKLKCAVLVLAIVAGLPLYSSLGLAEEAAGSLARRVKHRVSPTYPELARRMNIQGQVKLEVTVSASGKVKSTKVIGGHPLLVNASEDALRKWSFEPASADAKGIIEFEFHPQ